VKEVGQFNAVADGAMNIENFEFEIAAAITRGAIEI
jgi:hypothetical protein